MGLFYENSIFNNNLFNRPGRLAQGLFLNEAIPCAGGSPVSGFSLPGNTPLPAGLDLAAICGAPIGSVSSQLSQLQAAYQAATLAVGPASNGGFIGNTLAAGGGVNGINLFAPNYQTPRSVQMNIGFERQLSKGVVWTADYIRNVGTHTLLAIDVNHVGDVRFFNKANATAAIATTNAAFGCGSAATTAAINCAIAAGATMGDFAGNGLDSGTNLCGGLPCPTAAFPGKNGNLGVNQMLFPSGRSVYNALQTSLKANVVNPFAGVKALNWQVSYALSKYVGSALDSDFINTAIDNNHPVGSLGPNGLDRTHQFSFGGTFDFPWYIRFSVIGHVYSPLPVSLTLPAPGPGGIFISDVTGDGSGDGSGVYPTGDLVPGTKIGAFGRTVKPRRSCFLHQQLQFNASRKPNARWTGPDTERPVHAGAVAGPGWRVALPRCAAPWRSWVGLAQERLDLKFAYPRKIRENLVIEPSASIFNAFNNSNFDLPGSA